MDPAWTLEGPPLQRLFMPDGVTEPGNREDPFWGNLLAVAGWLGARAAMWGSARMWWRRQWL